MHRAEFERLLATPPRWRSAHFVIHHVAAPVLAPDATPAGPVLEDLPTGGDRNRDQPVDNFGLAYQLGVVVPKRHARRAVTRSVLKRLLRSSFARHRAALAPGAWLLRLRSPFAPPAFVSADSALLRSTARDEVEALLLRAAR